MVLKNELLKRTDNEEIKRRLKTGKEKYEGEIERKMVEKKG